MVHGGAKVNQHQHRDTGREQLVPLLRRKGVKIGRQGSAAAAERDHVKAAYRAIGIAPSADDVDSFVVGRAAYQRGARAADMPVKHNFSAS